jgi:hypothetical protein
MYIDIDNPLFSPELLNKDDVFALYHSFGGKGYACIVKVSGITKENFKTTYLHVCSLLGIEEFIDKNAVKASQFNVLSYDPDLYVNYYSTIFNSIEKDPTADSICTFKSSSNTNAKHPTAEVLLKEEEAYTTATGYSYRYNNLDEFQIEGDYAVDWNGKPVTKVFIQKKKVTGNRNNILLSTANNFVLLNPTVPRHELFDKLQSTNKKFVEPVDDAHIFRVIDTIFKQQKNGTLTPKNAKPRYIFFNPKSKLSKEDKLAICRQEYGKYRTDEVLQRIYNAIENWDFVAHGKITKAKLATTQIEGKKVACMNTLDKYWSQFKSFVKELNGGAKEVKAESETEKSGVIDGGMTVQQEIPNSENFNHYETEEAGKILEHLNMLERLSVPSDFIELARSAVIEGKILSRYQIEDMMEVLKIHPLNGNS